MLADRRSVEAKLFLAEVEAQGRKGPAFVAELDTPRPLLGVYALETLGFKVNPKTGELEEIAPEGGFLLTAAPRITAIICTLNEEESLPYVLPKIPGWVDEILLVDGHSTDNTVEVAKKLRPEIKVLSPPGKGKGDALRYGIQHASGDIIVTLDADGSTDPEEIPRFIEPLLNGYDFAKGSRFLGQCPNMPRQRRFANRLFAWLSNILYGTKYTDLCAGFNGFWKKILQQIDPEGTSFLDEPTINIRLKKRGLKVIEVPQPISISLHQSPHPLLSIIITSYTTERRGDIYELLDSIKEQTVISQKVNSRQSSTVSTNSTNYYYLTMANPDFRRRGT
jgi:hypothetical protein